MAGEVTKKDISKVAREMRPERKGVRQDDAPSYPSYRVEPDERFRIDDLDPDETEEYNEKSALKELERQRERIHEWQEKLYAEEKTALLVVLQAMDAGGKDGVGRGVFRGINPQGCHIETFNVATEDEKKQDFLWRYHRRVPPRGMIGVFNRSYYEGVMASRVRGDVEEDACRDRYTHINDFERLLTHDGVRVIKFFLHMSKDEQKRRLEERMREPHKYWLLSKSDFEERERWDQHMAAFEDAINNTSTEYAPWYALPSNNKWYRNLVIARTIADTLEAIGPEYPPLDEELQGMEVPD